jgi:hypothetical protein
MPPCPFIGRSREKSGRSADTVKTTPLTHLRHEDPKIVQRALAALHHFLEAPFLARWPEYLERLYLHVAENSDDAAPVSRQTRAWGTR